MFDDTVKNTFLEEVRRTGLVVTSARSAGTNSRRIKSECELDKEFALDFQEALQIYSELAQKELARRAIEGVEETVYFQGMPCGTKINYSNSLLTTLVKAKSPEFREKLSVDTTIHGGVLLTLPQAQTQEAWIAAANAPPQLPAPKNEENDSTTIIDIPASDEQTTGE